MAPHGLVYPGPAVSPEGLGYPVFAPAHRTRRAEAGARSRGETFVRSRGETSPPRRDASRDVPGYQARPN